MRVALYARVSTLKTQNPELQLTELREYCKARQLEIVGEFVDVGISGSRESRPQLNRLMADAMHHRFDVVLVWKLDRFARSLKHLVNALAEFDAWKIAFVSLQDNLDLGTPAGRLMFNVIGAMAEFERDLIRERVRAGMLHAKSQGKILGRKRTIMNAELINTLRSQGMPVRQIAKQAGTSVGTLYRQRSFL